MAKRLREHVKYSIKELDQYVETEGSCVQRVNTNLHLSLGPFCLADFKHILMAHIVRSKVGFYDIRLNGIVLDVKRVKILGTTAAMRADDPRLHVDVNADVYVFKPTEGAELSGVVKHIGAHHVGVVLYRVFNANLRVCHKVDKEEVQMDQSVKFRIRNYNLQNVFPYIDGELLTSSGETVKTKVKKAAFKDNDNADSGIEEKESVQELDELLSIIKNEEPDDYENVPSAKKSSKRSKKHSESMESNDSGTPVKKAKKKRKNSSTFTSTSIDCSESGDTLPPKKIKKEPEHSENEQSLVAIKKVKKEKSNKGKTKASHAKDVKIKQELDTDYD